MKKILMPTAMALFMGFVAESQAQQAAGSGATTTKQASGTNPKGSTNNSYNTSGQAGTTQGMGSRMDKKSMERIKQPSNGAMNSKSNDGTTTSATKKSTKSRSTTN